MEGRDMSTSVLFDAPGPRTVLRHRLYSLLALLAVLGVLAFVFVRFNDAGVFEADQWEVFTTPDYVRVILVDGLLNTLKMAGLAILGATVLGFLLGVGKLSDHALVRWPAWLVVEFFRAVPVLLLMVFTWYVLGIAKDGSSFWAVVIALTLYNGAVLAEVLRAGVNAVPKGQREAAYAIGMRKTQVMNIVLMPQAVKIMLPAIISQCIVALKDTALGQYVLAPGLTFVYKQIFLEFNNRVPTMIVIAGLYILVNLLLTMLATWAQKRFVGEKKPLEVPMVGTTPGGGAAAGAI
jgi:glutamate transport system permease protein